MLMHALYWISLVKMRFAVQDGVVKAAATLSLLKALDCSQQDEAELACQLMNTCTVLQVPVAAELQQAFLTGICQATNVVLALHNLQCYSEQADQQPQVYSPVLKRLASASGTQASWMSIHDCDCDCGN